MLPWNTHTPIKPTKKHAIIIGAGLAGTCAAYSLKKRGWKVTLIERHDAIAQEASGNPVGIITPLISHKDDIIGRFYAAGFEHTLKHLQQLKVPYNQCGVLEFGSSKINKSLEQLYIGEIEKLSAEQVQKICGAKRPALHIKNASYTSPPDLCKANIAEIDVIYNSEILQLTKNSDQWTLSGKNGEVASAPIVIIANANDAKNFAQTGWLPLVPVRGQISYLSGAIKTDKILCYDGGYVTPQINGINYLGATFDRENTSCQVTQSDHEENINNLSKILPTQNLKASEGRASLRATSPDRRPIIGAVPDYDAFKSDYADLKHGKQKQYPPARHHDGLYLSTGYGSRGLTAAPLAGELLSCMINNEEPPLEQKIIDALNPARFVIRQIKQSSPS